MLHGRCSERSNNFLKVTKLEEDRGNTELRSGWSWFLFFRSFVLSMLTSFQPLNHLIFLIKFFSTLMAWSNCGLNSGTCYCLMVQIRKLRPRKTTFSHTAAEPNLESKFICPSWASLSPHSLPMLNDPTHCLGSHEQEHTQLHLKVRLWLLLL